MRLIPLLNDLTALSHLSNGIAMKVTCCADAYDDEYKKHVYRSLGFDSFERDFECVILSEIANERGTYVVVGKNGRIMHGLKADMFFVDDDKFGGSVKTNYE